MDHTKDQIHDMTTQPSSNVNGKNYKTPCINGKKISVITSQKLAILTFLSDLKEFRHNGVCICVFRLWRGREKVQLSLFTVFLVEQEFIL